MGLSTTSVIIVVLIVSLIVFGFLIYAAVSISLEETTPLTDSCVIDEDCINLEFSEISSHRICVAGKCKIPEGGSCPITSDCVPGTECRYMGGERTGNLIGICTLPENGAQSDNGSDNIDMITCMVPIDSPFDPSGCKELVECNIYLRRDGFIDMMYIGPDGKEHGEIHRIPIECRLEQIVCWGHDIYGRTDGGVLVRLVWCCETQTVMCEICVWLDEFEITCSITHICATGDHKYMWIQCISSDEHTQQCYLIFDPIEPQFEFYEIDNNLMRCYGHTISQWADINVSTHRATVFPGQKSISNVKDIVFNKEGRIYKASGSYDRVRLCNGKPLMLSVFTS